MPKFISIIDNPLTEEQKMTLENYEVIELPKYLKKIWGNIPPEADQEGIRQHLQPLIKWLENQQINEDTIINIAGELSAVLIIMWSFVHIPIFVTATTRREVIETSLPDGGISKRSVLHHVRWRRVM